KVTSAREQQEEFKADYDSLSKESKELEEQAGAIIKEQEDIAKELINSQEIEKNTEESIQKFQEELEEKRKEESALSEELSKAEVETEKILQRAEFEQVNINRLNAEADRFREELEEIVTAIGNSTNELEQKEKDILEIEKTIAASHTTESDTEVCLKKDIEEKETLSAKQKNFFSEREELAQQITALDKEVYRLNAQKEKLQESIQNQIEYMWNEYEITLHDAVTLRDEAMNDLASMKKEVASLRDEIKKLGDVNVNAIEDFKEVSERYGFLKEQHDDLVEAEKTLVGIIEELDSAMRKQFKEKFQKINNEFDKVFKELFGGGKGTLELMEDEDILEAGVRIIAQPPGKKLQNMMQLSGGEKALTAIALLFAIQNLKPSPFCLLDEIEAALDENNVARFAKYLHKLTKHTQFIVITHRRGTMEKADRLYGITMQEKGISTLVSVNLIEDEIKN
ncbi:MAG: chromosome segregation protein SMC, partial [Lachnospiraceae bacterium]